MEMKDGTIWAEIHGFGKPIYLACESKPPYIELGRRNIEIITEAGIGHNERLLQEIKKTMEESDFLFSPDRPIVRRIVIECVEDSMDNFSGPFVWQSKWYAIFYALRTEYELWASQYGAIRQIG